MLAALQRYAAGHGRALTRLDVFSTALAWGLGHAATQGAFHFGALLPLTAGDGTYYPPQCPQMSVFLSGALNTLAFSLLLPSIMLLALDGYAKQQAWKPAYAAAAHLAAALLTLSASRGGGCVAAAGTLLAFGAVHAAGAAVAAWRIAMEAARLRVLDEPRPEETALTAAGGDGARGATHED